MLLTDRTKSTTIASADRVKTMTTEDHIMESNRQKLGGCLYGQRVVTVTGVISFCSIFEDKIRTYYRQAMVDRK